MTALEACDKIQEAIDGLHNESRNSGWDWSFTAEQSDDAHLSDYKETLEKTRAHFNIEGDTSSWSVSTSGTNAVLAKCGNSPTAEARSRYISWVNPKNVKLLIDRIRVLERALLIKAKRDHLPVDVITPERRVERWIEDAEESLKPVDAEEASV